MDKPRRGFTLIEVLVVTALVGIIIVLVSGILLANNRFFNNQFGEVRAIFGTRHISDRIMEYGRLAVSVAAGYTYNFVDYTSGADTVIFRIPAIDSANQIVADTYDRVIITRDTVNQARLLLFVDPDPLSARNSRSVELTDKLSTITFTYTPDIATADTVNYTVQINSGGANAAVETVDGQVTFRNK